MKKSIMVYVVVILLMTSMPIVCNFDQGEYEKKIEEKRVEIASLQEEYRQKMIEAEQLRKKLQDFQQGPQGQQAGASMTRWYKTKITTIEAQARNLE